MGWHGQVVVGLTTPELLLSEVSPETVAAALDRGAIEAHYQPIVLLPSGQVVGFEALARLRDLDGTVLPPSAFISVAERSGLIVRLGLQVLRLAVAEAASWRVEPGQLAVATISVNVAPPQLEQPDFVDVVSAVLTEFGLPGTALVLEITESVATSAAVRPVLERLSALGIRVALDDFGTGFATLENLRWLPVQILKLDRGFVAGVAEAGADRAIVRAVVSLADSLGLSVIAEGVETQQQADALLLIGCPVLQGYLYSRPQSDPLMALQSVRQVVGSIPPPQLRGGDSERWSMSLDGAVLAAARLLDDPNSKARGTVHAVALAVAERLGLTGDSARLIGRLALVHDIHRLSVDSELPAPFINEPMLVILDGAIDPAPPEVAIVRIAALAVEQTVAIDVNVGATALALGLLRAADLLPGSLSAYVETVRELSANPPPAHLTADLLDDFDRRRMGRHGMEDRLRSLVGITRVLSSSRDNRELLRAALEEVRRIVGAASASLERWERDSGQLRCLVSVGQLGPGEETFPEDELYPLSEFAQARRTMLTGLPYLHTVDDLDADPEAVELLRSLNKYSSAAVPVYLEARMWGQVWLATSIGEPPFRSGDVELLLSVATLMGSVVVQAENLERVGRAAFEDALTRVGNRRSVDDALGRLSATGTPTTAVLLDLDLLKEINDSHGHASGDEAIRRTADTLSREVAGWPGGVVGRLGGDEFCVLLPGCTAEIARTRIGGALRRLRLDGGPAVSMGVAQADAPWLPRDLLFAADTNLYAAKGIARQERDRRRAGDRRRSTGRDDGSPRGRGVRR